MTTDIVFKHDAPSPESFLRSLGKTFKALYPRVRSTFCKFFEENSPYDSLILHTHIGWGCNCLSALVLVYTTAVYESLAEPKATLGLDPSAEVVQLLVSNQLNKSHELLLEPIINILEASSLFRNVAPEELDPECHEDHTIRYALNVGDSAILFDSGLSYKLVSEPEDAKDYSVLSVYMGELPFYFEKGKSTEDVLNYYKSFRSMLCSKMKYDHGFLARAILDAPLFAFRHCSRYHNALTDYIGEKADEDDDSLVVQGSAWQWDVKHVSKDTFKVAVTQKPHIISKDEVVSDDCLVIDVPEHYRPLFEEDPESFLLDRAGVLLPD